jgi:S1-C subfamily serine protease
MKEGERIPMQNIERNDVTYTSNPLSPQEPDLPSKHSRRASRGLRTGAIIALVVMLALVFGTGLFAGWQFASTRGSGTRTLQPGTNTGTVVPPANGENAEAVREAVIAKVRPAVVQINVATVRGQGLGSGVIIDQRGYIVTNNHVVEGARQIQVVLYDGRTLPAQTTGTSLADDLAILKVTPPKNGALTVATLGDSSQVQVGQEVLAIGNPLGITQTVTSGIVSALGRDVGSIRNAIQTDAAINPGNSGGALVDLQGNVIGIPTATALDPEFKAPANGVGFAIPSNRVQFIAPQLIETGKVTNSGRAALGVQVTNVDAVIAEQNGLAVDHGVLIASVTPNGPAAKVGLQAGDVLVKLADKEVNNTALLSDALLSQKPGDTVPVQVYRGNQQLTINVKLGELPAR